MPSPHGFGAEELPVPPGANISQAHVIHRHGSRYPTTSSGAKEWAEKIRKHSHEFSGRLAFLKDWKYLLGLERLTANGRLELFKSGVLHNYNYGKLYNETERLVARTTTEYRMLESAENFLAGFFGLNWAKKVDLEVIIESEGFNNSLSGGSNCPNIGKAYGVMNSVAGRWKDNYLKKATKRFRKESGNYNWSTHDSVLAQEMCSYETIALGSSPFCVLFTWDEWKGYEYYSDLKFHTVGGFASPVGRAMGIGYIAEFIARAEHRLYDLPPGKTQANITLDTNPSTFPTNQNLYLDFSHDTNILSVLTAFGLRQFSQHLPTSGAPKRQQLLISHVTPFAGRLTIEIIKAPGPVHEKRLGRPGILAYDVDQPQKETRYVHFVLNQRTVPLGKSFKECGERDDGWCELETFLRIQKQNIDRAKYEYSCFGDYEPPKYGDVTDGVFSVDNQGTSLNDVFGKKMDYQEAQQHLQAV